MAGVEKVSVALTPELAALMREVVKAGEYASASEVMREALRDWRARRLERERLFEALGREWDAGLASGPAQDGAEAFTDLRAWMAEQEAEAGRRGARWRYGCARLRRPTFRRHTVTSPRTTPSRPGGGSSASRSDAPV
jgi:antitoxin ParD1/3/4